MLRSQGQADFVHLHNHSEFSLLDGASRIEEMVKLARQYGMRALALTDHGNMFGAIKFYKAAKDAGLKPIIGAEVYVAPGDRREKKIHPDVPESSFHLTLLCQDEQGYRNLMRLVSYAWLEGFYYHPRIDKELLAQFSQGLIGLSGCLKGEVNYYLRKGDTERALQAAASYQEILGPGNFYLEVMRAGWAEQESIIPAVIELGATLDIPIVATNDCHYCRPEDARAHDALVCIQTGKRLKDQNRLRMSSTQLFFRSGAEMARIFHDLPEAVQRTAEVAERCNLELDFEHKRFHVPAYRPPEGFHDELCYLRHLARTGLEKRYAKITPGLEERLNYELDVIQRMGFPGYFLVVKDIVDFARSKGIPVGPGRGSAAGSLVLYCLGITEIDPIRYGLLFERFLSTERVSLPDIDIDFADARRGEVIDYIRNRYGKDSVAQIITFGTMQARAVVRDVGRVMDIPIPEVDQIAKLIPPGMELDAAITSVTELRDLIESRSDYREMWQIARKLEGLSRHASVHASAVVIAPGPLIELVPLAKPGDGEVCTQYDMYSLEDIGLVKLDVLGLRTLTVIDEGARLVRASGKKLELGSLQLDDAKTFRLIQRGDTIGVFQLESAGMRDLCRRMMPERIEHLIALIALYRPGPMELIDEFLARKAGSRPIEYEHPLLEQICRETYGIMIYQEQVMQAAQALAGYTLGRADLLRRAMGKKLPEEMAAQRDVFVEGCIRHNRIDRHRANRIFDLLARFAGYGFNKSHAAGYAFLSYVTAYLKANHPVEFLAASLTSELGDFKKLAKLVSEARRMGIEVLGPDVNSSYTTFTIEEGKIRFGLAGIKNIGTAASEGIVQERERAGPYRSLLDFLVRNRGSVNRKAVESLIKAGAFDRFEPNRSRLLEGLDREMDKAASERLRFSERQVSMFDIVAEPAPAETRDFDTQVRLAYEKEAFGFYFSAHPLDRFRVEYQALGLVPIGQVERMRDGSTVAIGGVVTSRRIRTDRRERQFLIATVEDYEGAIEVLVFSEQFDACQQFLKVDQVVAVQGVVKVMQSADRPGSEAAQGVGRIWASRVWPLADCSQFLRQLILELDDEQLDEERLRLLKQILEKYPGDAPVFLVVSGKGRPLRRLRLRMVKVRLAKELVQELGNFLGPDRVRLEGRLP